MTPTFKIYQGNSRVELSRLDSKSVDLTVTSPDYWQQRGSSSSSSFEYGDKIISLEKYCRDYIANLLEVFNGHVHRVLKDTGVLFIVINDSYNTPKVGNTNGVTTTRGSGTTKQKKGFYEQGTSGVNKVLQPGLMRGTSLFIPEQLALGMISSGKWACRNKIIWLKRNGQPNTAPRSRYGLGGFEYVYMFTKQETGYYFRCPQVPRIRPKIDKKNPSNDRITKYVRDVWPVPRRGSKEKHYSTFPIVLADRCITSACPLGGVVMDPFCGSATTGAAALLNNRNFIGFEIEPAYAQNAKDRLDRLLTDKQEFNESLQELVSLRRDLMKAETDLFSDDEESALAAATTATASSVMTPIARVSRAKRSSSPTPSIAHPSATLDMFGLAA